MGFLMVMHIVA